MRILLRKEVFSPSNDVHDNFMNDANKVPKDPKQSSQKPFTPPLPFPQRMDKTKQDLQFG